MPKMSVDRLLKLEKKTAEFSVDSDLNMGKILGVSIQA